MTTVLPTLVDLTRRILAVEAARAKSAETRVDEAVRVCEKLQVTLTRLMGSAGFTSLLNRSLALAKAEVPSLRLLQIRLDGSLAGFDEIKHDENAEALEKGRVILVGQFLGLLAIFIGESLTRRIVLDTWSDASIGDLRI